ncbi:apelin receptor-like [Notamacropus eugenii]|uniref:apelin receptor-like n=1 Tax=Notamacropus eugenii TaxID=9315 RepID=UPI003B685CC4
MLNCIRRNGSSLTQGYPYTSEITRPVLPVLWMLGLSGARRPQTRASGSRGASGDGSQSGRARPGQTGRAGPRRATPGHAAMEPWTAEPRGPAPDYYYDYYNGSGGASCGGEDAEPEDWELSYALLPALYTLVFVLGLSGNGLVIVTVWLAPGGAGGGAKRRASDAYIGHLALADLAFVVTLPLWAVYTALRFHWPFGAALCKLSSYLVLLNMFASAFCLTGLSFERYLAAGRSLGRGGPAPQRARPGASAALAALWLLAALLALPALLLRDTRARPPANLTVCDMDFSGVAAAPEHEAYWLGGLSLATTLLGFALPAALMGVFYCCIGCAVSRHFGAGGRALGAAGAERAVPRGRGRGQRRRLLRLLAALVAVFALCWLPFHVLKSLYVLSWLGLLALPCAGQALIVRLHPYATCLAYVNSCLNPLLYAFLDRRFRAQCRRRLLPGRCCLLRPLLPSRPGRRACPPASGHRFGEPAAPASSSASGASSPTQRSELASLATKV